MSIIRIATSDDATAEDDSMSTRRLFELQAKYHIAPEATPDQLRSDVAYLLSSGVSMMELLAESYEGPDEPAFYGALLLLKQAEAMLSAAERRPTREPMAADETGAPA